MSAAPMCPPAPDLARAAPCDWVRSANLTGGSRIRGRLGRARLARSGSGPV